MNNDYLIFSDESEEFFKLSDVIDILDDEVEVINISSDSSYVEDKLEGSHSSNYKLDCYHLENEVSSHCKDSISEGQLAQTNMIKRSVFNSTNSPSIESINYDSLSANNDDDNWFAKVYEKSNRSVNEKCKYQFADDEIVPVDTIQNSNLDKSSSSHKLNFQDSADSGIRLSFSQDKRELDQLILNINTLSTSAGSLSSPFKKFMNEENSFDFDHSSIYSLPNEFNKQIESNKQMIFESSNDKLKCNSNCRERNSATTCFYIRWVRVLLR